MIIAGAAIFAMCAGMLSGCGGSASTAGGNKAAATTAAGKTAATAASATTAAKATTAATATTAAAASGGDYSNIQQSQDKSKIVVTDTDGPFGKYPEPITLTMVKGYSTGDDWKLEALKKVGETLEDNRNTRVLRDKLNINVKYDWIVDSSQYDQKLKLAISSGDIPDVIKVNKNNLVQMNQMAEAGLIQPLGDLWAKYASPLSVKYATADGGLTTAALSYNGQMYGIPEADDSDGTIGYMWIRIDWMDKLGLKPPTNISELQDYMRAMVENDPDGNGVKDTYGMLMTKDLYEQINPICWMFKAYPTTWYENPNGDGSLVWGPVQPEMKQPLSIIHQMYADGWIDPEFTVKDYTKAIEIIASGKCGLVFGPHWSTHIGLYQSRDNDPKADWCVYELPKDLNGNPTKVRIEMGLQSAVCVRAGYEHPEAAIKMLNMYNETMFGDDGDYEYYCSPKIDGQMLADLFTLAPITGLYSTMDVDNENINLSAFDGKIDPATLTGVPKVFYDNCKAEWTWWRMFGPDRSAGRVMSMVYGDRKTYTQPNLFNGAPTQTMIDRWDQLKEYVDTSITKMITGELNTDSDFDKFVTEWNNMGGAQVTKEVSDWYKANKK